MFKTPDWLGIKVSQPHGVNRKRMDYPQYISLNWFEKKSLQEIIDLCKADEEAEEQAEHVAYILSCILWYSN